MPFLSCQINCYFRKVARPMKLHAGKLQLIFDPQTLSVRGIRWNGREIVRAIYGAIRDADWGTVAPAVSDLQVQADDSAFAVSFTAECVSGEIDFLWEGRITGSAP